MRSIIVTTCLVLAVAGCGGNTPDPDRSAEAINLCESEVAKRLGLERRVLTYESAAKRFGSGGWDVEGTVSRPSARPVPFACGIYADGSRDRGALRADAVRVPATRP